MRPIFHSISCLISVALLAAPAQAQQTPAITPGSVSNAASANTPVALGSLISIYGTSLSPVTDIDTVTPLPPTMDGVSVTVNGVVAPLWFVSAGQINAQIPWEALAAAPPTTANATAQVIVSTKTGGASAPEPITIAPVAPGIFTFSYGAGQAIAYNYADGTFAAAATIPGYPTVPVRPVKINDPNPLVIYATGLGAVSPSVASGYAPATGIVANTLVTPQVLVGGVPAQVNFSGLSPYVGVYQLNVTVNTGTPTGSAIPLQIQMNGVISRNDVTIAVSQ